MYSELWEKTNYTTDAMYIISRHIYEYDISKANINVLYYLGEIDKDYYERLKKLPKIKRQIEIGYLIKYTEGLDKRLKNGIKEFRRKLFEENNIQDIEVLSIKNDAIFVIGRKLQITKFGNVEFVEKNHYTTYVRLSKHLEIFFESNTIDSTISLDIKGISDLKLENHHLYMASFIADILYYMETNDIASGLSHISDFYNEYIERKLPIGYYRNFNAESNYIININGNRYSIDFCRDDMINSIDIGCNLNIIRTLYGYLTNLYMQQNK